MCDDLCICACCNLLQQQEPNHNHTELLSYLRDCLLGASVEGVFAHVHQLFEEQVANLGEASTGRLHQGVQYGADVGLDTDL